jgi:hypothetical protein
VRPVPYGKINFFRRAEEAPLQKENPRAVSGIGRMPMLHIWDGAKFSCCQKGREEVKDQIAQVLKQYADNHRTDDPQLWDVFAGEFRLAIAEDETPKSAVIRGLQQAFLVCGPRWRKAPAAVEKAVWELRFLGLRRDVGGLGLWLLEAGKLTEEEFAAFVDAAVNTRPAHFRQSA